MNNKGSAIILVLLAIAFLGVSLIVLMFDWAWVDIQTTESSQNIHLKMPIPINLVSFALNFVPKEGLQVEVPKEVWENKELIIEALQAIADSPDAILIRVKTPDAKVLVEKSKGRVILNVEAEDATVRAALPVQPMINILKKWDWKQLEPKIALDIFAACGSGSYLIVDSEEAKVKITS